MLLARLGMDIGLLDDVRIYGRALDSGEIEGLLHTPEPTTAALLAIGLAGLAVRMLVHAFTLPIEWDASFNKAMPIIIKGRYVAPGEVKSVERVLKAAAYTYVAAALADILNLARWAALLLRR